MVDMQHEDGAGRDGDGEYPDRPNRRRNAQPPLRGFRILSVEQYGAGPFATMILGDLGAEVIKVEDPGAGDVARHVPPYTVENDSIYFQSLNRRKKSVALDTRTEEGRLLFRELAASCDAVFSNLRGDQVEKRGLDYDSLSSVNPRIVCCHLSGFGLSGRRAREPGYDYLMQGYAGWMTITGEPDGPPVKSGLSLVDLSAGVFAGLGLVSALHRARETGIGCDVEVSLFDTAVSLLTYVGAWHLSRGYEPRRWPLSSHPSQVPSQILPSADGWFVVMCAKEKFFRRLIEVMDLATLGQDPRFDSFEARLAHREELIEILAERSRTETTNHWLERLRGLVPVGPVNTVAEALRDPAVIERGMIVEIEHPTLGPVRALASPIRVRGGQPDLCRGPALGEHTEDLLVTLLGKEAGEIAALEEAGIVECWRG